MHMCMHTHVNVGGGACVCFMCTHLAKSRGSRNCLKGQLPVTGLIGHT